MLRTLYHARLRRIANEVAKKFDRVAIMQAALHTFILNWTLAKMKHVTSFPFALVLLLLAGVGVWQPVAAQTYPYLSHEVHATSAFGTTYRVYANFANANDRVGAVLAQTNALTGVIDELSIATTTSFYQFTAAGEVNFGDEVNLFLLGFLPNLAFDSWFTIGVTNSSEGAFDYTPGWTSAFAAFNSGNGFVVNDAMYYIAGANELSTAPAFCIAGSDLKVLLGQFTVANTSGGSAGHLSLTFNIQWFPHNVGAGGEIRALDLTLNTATGAPVPGCTNAAACNYNAAATTDNGSCIVPTGCDSCSGGALVDGDTDNDGVCNANEVVGCQTVGACNYNAAATDPGTCNIASGCDTCSGASVVDGDADNDGVCNANEILGCTVSTACNFNATATENNGTCVFAFGCDVCSGGAVVDNDADNDGVCNANEIPGCTSSTACNYNAAATDNNGSCIFATGCDSCSGGAVVDGDTDNDGVCNTNEITGCQTVGACNYNAAATNAGSCVFATGCDTCSGGAVVDGDSDDDGVCNANEITGCQTVGACNYNAAATNAGSCVFATGCDTCAGGAVVDGDSDNDGVCNANEIVGCQTAGACNYNAAATDAGTCTYATTGYTCGGACIADTDGDGVCDSFEISGCTIVSACNYNAAATDANNATCTYPPAGGTCGSTCTGDWDGDGVCDNNEVDGCMSSSATNYNSSATDDDGSCTWAFGLFQGLSYERVAVNGIAGTSTYRVYADFGSDAVQVIAAYGSKNMALVPPVNEPWRITSTQPFYQNAGGALLSDGILPALYPVVSGLQYDSWLSLGGQPGELTGVSLVQPAGNPFNAFGTSGANVVVDDPVGATMFYTPGSTPANYPDAGKLLIGQFTTAGVVSLQYNFQLFFNNITYRITDVELQFPVQGPGCMDATACNFDPSATVDNGSCTYPSSTCRNCAGACTLDANTDGVCDCEVVLGCMDSTATNFNAAANTSDASCTYAGCQTDFTACNYNPLADVDNPSLCDYPEPFCDCDGDCAAGDYEGDGVQEVDEVAGCTSQSATNYNAAATNDDGSCIWNPDLFQGLTYDVTLNSVPGYTTYRVYAEFSAEAEVIALFGGSTPTGGASGYPWHLQTTGSFYQNTAAGAGTANLVNPLLYPFFPGLQYDSWFTIGAEPGQPSDLAVAYMSGSSGALAQWNTTGTFNTTSGAIFVTPGSALDQGATDAEGRVLIGQFTTNGVGYGIFNLQYLDGSGAAHIVYDVELIFPPMSPGCQDPTSLTYDADSNFPDPSLCVFPGCTDPDACNYDDDANLEDGSCILPVGCETCSGATDGTGTVVDNDDDNDGVCNDDEIEGCQTVGACNYNPAATDAGTCIIATGCDFCSAGVAVDGDTDNDGVCDVNEIVGCQTSGACNYNAAATDPGMCITATGCDFCSAGAAVDGDADDDGVCNPDEIVGCQTIGACNYNPAATDPGTCIGATGCDYCSAGVAVDGDTDNDGVCDVNEIVGCQTAGACNYNPAATDAATCYFASGCDYCQGGAVVDGDTDNDGVCNDDEVVGCQIVGATNYNPLATDPAICSGCNVIGADNYNPLDQNGIDCEIGGCMYDAATNYNPLATYDDLSCDFSCTGDLNGDGNITVEDLLNLFQVYGTSCPD